MRKRGQIAACTHAALRRDYRMNAALQHLAQRLDDQRTHARVSLGHGVGAQQHHGARLKFTQRLAHADAMRSDQIELQVADLLRRNAHVAQLAHAGVDGIRDLVPRELLFDDRTRAFHRCARSWLKRDWPRLLANFAELFQREIVAVNVQWFHWLGSSRRACRGKSAQKAARPALLAARPRATLPRATAWRRRTV